MNARARMAFRIKSEMVNKIKTNYKGSYKNKLACDKCEGGRNETQCHAIMCPGWVEQCDGLDERHGRVLHPPPAGEGKGSKEGLP